jgi:hypothetical protein
LQSRFRIYELTIHQINLLVTLELNNASKSIRYIHLNTYLQPAYSKYWATMTLILTTLRQLSPTLADSGETFAPQPHPSMFCSTPILTQIISEDEPQVNEFSTSLHRPTDGEDINFDHAASAFPDIDIDSGETFAPQPHPSVFSSTPILTQTISEDEPQVNKCV